MFQKSPAFFGFSQSGIFPYARTIIYNNYNSTIIRRKTNRKIFEKTAFGATRTAQLKKLKNFWINF